MKYLLVPVLALGIGTAALAQTSAPASAGNYPACSRTVADECTDTAARPAHHAGKAAHATHRAAHHRHAAKKSG